LNFTYLLTYLFAYLLTYLLTCLLHPAWLQRSYIPLSARMKRLSPPNAHPTAVGTGAHFLMTWTSLFTWTRAEHEEDLSDSSAAVSVAAAEHTRWNRWLASTGVAS